MSNPRRTFLKFLAAGPVACACTNNAGVAASFGDASAGNVSATRVGTLALLPNGTPAVLARDKDGLYAMTITCTHQGCDVSPNGGSSLYCPCHGSTFDSNGNVTGGPAPSPLVHFAVSVDANGNITVHGGTQVAASVRTTISA